MTEEDHHSDSSSKHSKGHLGIHSLHLPFHLPGKHHHHHETLDSSNHSGHGRVSPIMFLPRRHSHQTGDGSQSDDGKSGKKKGSRRSNGDRNKDISRSRSAHVSPTREGKKVTALSTVSEMWSTVYACWLKFICVYILYNVMWWLHWWYGLGEW